MKMALEGVKVLDLSRVLAGPYCTMLLADMGAEVIKIERPETGDDSRSFGPFVGKESLYFNGINRNKKSVEMNLKDEQDRNTFLELVKEADVVVENFRPGTMKKLGLDYEALQEVNPKIIYAATSGFGQTGPYSDKPAYDLIIQAMGGLMSITGQSDGMPTKVGPSIADITSGIYTALGVSSALYYREQTGEGQMVDVSMLDCQISVLENAIARYQATGEDPDPIGNRHPTITPFTMLNTKDNFIVVAIGNEKLWEIFCETIGKTDLMEDDRFIDNRSRTDNFKELEEIINSLFITKTTDEWMEILDAQGIPCSPVNKISDVLENEQVKARQIIEEIDHPTLDKVLAPSLPIKFSKTPSGIRKPAPTLGENNWEYKKEQKYNNMEV